MTGIFDIYELMPHTDCGKCVYRSCLKFAEALSRGQAQPSECSVMHNDKEAQKAMEKLLKE